MTPIRRLVAAVAISTAVFTVAPLPAAAAPASGTTYVVESGDFLLRIAREHGVTLRALLDANGLTVQSVIIPGQRLQIPAGGTTPTGATTPAAPASPSGSGTTASGTTHTVVAGDALSAIARRYGVSLSALLRANDLTLTSLILPGQRLQIPAGGTTPTGATTPAAPASPSGGSSGSGTTASGTTHTVVAGDALSAIARRYGVSLSALLRANDLTLTSLILPGQRLQIPAGGTTPTGATTPAAPASPSGGSTTTTSSRLDRVVSYAMAQVGKPYKFFTRGPATFDCSGLTLAAYEQAGISLIHYSAAQATQGREVDLSRESIRPGDLVFLSLRESLGINHVGIATSSTTWVHATGPGDTVRTGRIPAASSITTVRRFIES